MRGAITLNVFMPIPHCLVSGRSMNLGYVCFGSFGFFKRFFCGALFFGGIVLGEIFECGGFFGYRALFLFALCWALIVVYYRVSWMQRNVLQRKLVNSSYYRVYSLEKKWLRIFLCYIRYFSWDSNIFFLILRLNNCEIRLLLSLYLNVLKSTITEKHIQQLIKGGF